MRIIQEIGRKETIQMTASGHAYRGVVGREHEWIGWHCQLLITSRDVLTGEELPIEIEGDGDAVIHALKTAYMMLEGYGADLREKHADGISVNPPALRVTR